MNKEFNKGLLLAGWIADRLNWKIENLIYSKKDQLKVNFLRQDKTLVEVGITSLPIGKPSMDPIDKDFSIGIGLK